jgi:hypothetical protein
VEHRRSLGGRTAAIAAVTVIVVVLLAIALAFAVAGSNRSRPLAVVTPPGPSASAPIVPTATVSPEPGPAPSAGPAPLAPALLVFDEADALAEMRSIVSFGVRKGGSPAEAKTAEWLKARMTGLGYAAVIEDVPLPDGTTSHNVIARSRGASRRVVALGAHMDTKPPSPGANDNASGCGALLEIAGILASQPVTATVEFVFFGTEEIMYKNSVSHHFGSRYRVDAMGTGERSNTAGMISLDMIGVGRALHARSMGKGPRSMTDLALRSAKSSGVKMTFLRDPSSTGSSDHEPYELAGIPATWIEWRDDPNYHTAKDTMSRLSGEKVRVAGQLVLDMLRSLDEVALEKLVAR